MAISTLSPSGSSIHEWLNFDPETLKNLATCVFNGTKVDCAQVCDDEASLLSAQASNLVTCGIWTSIALASSDYGNGGSLNLTDDSLFEHLSPVFEAVNLGVNNLQNAVTYAEAISKCFSTAYDIVKSISFTNAGNTPAVCSREQLFPFASSWVFRESSPLTECVEAICSTVTLDQDLAGIGVLSSFFAQSALVLVAFTILLFLELRFPATLPLHKSPKNWHAAKVVVGLVEFHKAQCYFSTIIQIPALILSRRSNGWINSGDTNISDIHNMSVMILSASSGLLPITLTLACITRYGRQSWYLLVLSWMTILLASATLMSFYRFVQSGEGSIYDSMLGIALDFTSAPNPSGQADGGQSSGVVISLCGNSKLLNNVLPHELIDKWWTFLIWANCIIWMLFCLWKKCNDTGYLSGLRQRLNMLSLNNHLVRLVLNKSKSRRVWFFVSIIPWSLCFAWQLYLFKAFFDHELISYAWSFGQIIAVFVWVPSIVECIYIVTNGIVKASSYKYPSPLFVTSNLAQTSFATLACLGGSYGVLGNEVLVWPPDISRREASASRLNYQPLDGSRELT